MWHTQRKPGAFSLRFFRQVRMQRLRSDQSNRPESKVVSVWLKSRPKSFLRFGSLQNLRLNQTANESKVSVWSEATFSCWSTKYSNSLAFSLNAPTICSMGHSVGISIIECRPSVTLHDVSEPRRRERTRSEQMLFHRRILLRTAAAMSRWVRVYKVQRCPCMMAKRATNPESSTNSRAVVRSTNRNVYSYGTKSLRMADKATRVRPCAFLSPFERTEQK